MHSILKVMALKKTLFIKNAAVLTSTGLFLRLFGIIFKIWLTRMIGQAGIGLYQIVFSFYILASTFATTGIPTAVTRLCSDEADSKKGIKKIVAVSIAVMLLLAGITILLLVFGAEFISKKVLSDIRASFSIKIMGFSLPFTGICSCLRGYFIARRKATPSAVSQILEQIVRILFVFIGVTAVGTVKIDIVCGVVFLADAVAEGFSCLYLALIYRFDLSKLKSRGDPSLSRREIIRKTGEIALPITGGRYLNSLLRTFENILVPKNLIKSGCSGESALSKLGMIKGSALPILFFPSTLLNSMSTLLLPELSTANKKNRAFIIKSTVEETIITISYVSFLISALFFVFGEELGVLLYNNRSVGRLIRALAPTVPFMYLDSICDGMLKGLNKQNFTFAISIVDSLVRLGLIVLLVPRFGIRAFVGIMYFSNAFTGFLNIRMLIKTGKAKIRAVKNILAPLCCAITVTLVVGTVARALVPGCSLVYIILTTVFSCVIYIFAVSRLTGYNIFDNFGDFKQI